MLIVRLNFHMSEEPDAYNSDSDCLFCGRKPYMIMSWMRIHADLNKYFHNIYHPISLVRQGLRMLKEIEINCTAHSIAQSSQWQISMSDR